MKKPTQEEEILRLFKDGSGTFETKDIPYTLAFEYQRALWTLRANGHNIPKAERITQGNYRYRLIAPPAQQAAPAPAKFGKDPQGELGLDVRADYEH